MKLLLDKADELRQKLRLLELTSKSRSELREDTVIDFFGAKEEPTSKMAFLNKKIENQLDGAAKLLKERYPLLYGIFEHLPNRYFAQYLPGAAGFIKVSDEIMLVFDDAYENIPETVSKEARDLIFFLHLVGLTTLYHTGDYEALLGRDIELLFRVFILRTTAYHRLTEEEQKKVREAAGVLEEFGLGSFLSLLDRMQKFNIETLSDETQFDSVIDFFAEAYGLEISPPDRKTLRVVLKSHHPDFSTIPGPRRLNFGHVSFEASLESDGTFVIKGKERETGKDKTAEWGLDKIVEIMSRTKPFMIGRYPDSDIRLDSDLTSRRHARLFFELEPYVAEGFQVLSVYVQDLGSTNGTYLDGVRLESNERKLFLRRVFPLAHAPHHIAYLPDEPSFEDYMAAIGAIDLSFPKYQGFHGIQAARKDMFEIRQRIFKARHEGKLDEGKFILLGEANDAKWAEVVAEEKKRKARSELRAEQVADLLGRKKKPENVAPFLEQKITGELDTAAKYLQERYPELYHEYERLPNRYFAKYFSGAAGFMGVEGETMLVFGDHYRELGEEIPARARTLSFYLHLVYLMNLKHLNQSGDIASADFNQVLSSFLQQAEAYHNLNPRDRRMLRRAVVIWDRDENFKYREFLNFLGQFDKASTATGEDRQKMVQFLKDHAGLSTEGYEEPAVDDSEDAPPYAKSFLRQELIEELILGELSMEDRKLPVWAIRKDRNSMLELLKEKARAGWFSWDELGERVESPTSVLKKGDWVVSPHPDRKGEFEIGQVDAGFGKAEPEWELSEGMEKLRGVRIVYGQDVKVLDLKQRHVYRIATMEEYQKLSQQLKQIILEREELFNEALQFLQDETWTSHKGYKIRARYGNDNYTGERTIHFISEVGKDGYIFDPRDAVETLGLFVRLLEGRSDSNYGRLSLKDKERIARTMSEYRKKNGDGFAFLKHHTLPALLFEKLFL